MYVLKGWWWLILSARSMLQDLVQSTVGKCIGQGGFSDPRKRKGKAEKLILSLNEVMDDMLGEAFIPSAVVQRKATSNEVFDLRTSDGSWTVLHLMCGALGVGSGRVDVRDRTEGLKYILSLDGVDPNAVGGENNSTAPVHLLAHHTTQFMSEVRLLVDFPSLLSLTLVCVWC